MEDQENQYDELFAAGPAPDQPEAVTPEPQAEPTPTPTPEPVAEAQPQPATTADNPFDSGSAQWKAFERLRESERERARAEAELAARRAAEERDRQWQTYLQQQQQPVAQDEPEPDRYLEPEAHDAWKDRQIERKLAERDAQWERRIADLQRQEAERQQELLMREVGVPTDQLQAAYAFVQEKQPYMIAGLNAAPNPYRALIEHAKLIGFNVPNQPSQPSQPGIVQAAAQAAAVGAPPQTTAPRGVGSLPGGQGYGTEAVPAISDFKRLAKSDPDAWAATVEQLMQNGPGPLG